MANIRIDDLLVEEGLASDRREASALLMSGVVLVDNQKVEKAGVLVSPGAKIRLLGETNRFVSRGGLKLEAALQALSIDVSGRVCCDLGASTGGFTDCLLQAGAARVYAFDVGRGLLDWKLQQDSRVIMHDAFNVRNLTPGDIPEKIDLFTADLSFISLRLILPVLQQFPDSRFLLLVKPQFEAKPDEVERGGLILDLKLREEIIGRVEQLAVDFGFKVEGQVASSLRGQKGNLEHFLYLSYQARPGREEPHPGA